MSLQIVFKDRPGMHRESFEEFAKEARETYEMLKSSVSARRAIRIQRTGGECFAPLVCFAQLRAEGPRNGARGLRRTP